MIRSIIYFCAVSSIVSLAAFAQQHAPAPRGQKEFVQSCGFCHGEAATGGRAPDLVRSPLVAKDSVGDLIGPVIRSGRPDNGMPALPLPDSTIQDIVAFLHLRVKQAVNSSMSAAIIRWSACSPAMPTPAERISMGQGSAHPATRPPATWRVSRRNMRRCT